MKHYATMLLPVIGLYLAGCVNYVEPKAIDQLNEQYRLVYKKIEDASVNLAAMSDEVVFTSGEAAVLELTITNSGTKILNIPEWYQEENNNFLVHFRPLKSNETPEEAINAEWFMIAPEFVKGEQPVRRHFALAPGNTAICSVPLDFIQSIPADKDMIFIAFAELNLTSITATSPMFIIVAQSSKTEI